MKLKLTFDLEDDDEVYNILTSVVKMLKEDARVCKGFDAARAKQLKDTAANLNDLAKDYYSVPGTR